MKNSIRITYPDTLQIVMGSCFATFSLAIMIWLAVGLNRGTITPVIPPEGIGLKWILENMAALGILLAVFFLGFLVAILLRDYEFSRSGVMIIARCPTRERTLRFIPWEEVDELVIKRGRNSIQLAMKLKNGRQHQLLYVKQLREKVVQLREEILALRDGPQ